MLVSLSTMILEGLKDLGMSSSIGFQYLEESALRGRVDGWSISYIFKYLDVPILVLVDEVQNLLPRDPNSGEVDKTSQISAGKLLKVRVSLQQIININLLLCCPHRLEEHEAHSNHEPEEGGACMSCCLGHDACDLGLLLVLLGLLLLLA